MQTAVLFGLVATVTAAGAACSYYVVERTLLRVKSGLRRSRKPIEIEDTPPLRTQPG